MTSHNCNVCISCSLRFLDYLYTVFNIQVLFLATTIAFISLKYVCSAIFFFISYVYNFSFYEQNGPTWQTNPSKRARGGENVCNVRAGLRAQGAC